MKYLRIILPVFLTALFLSVSLLFLSNLVAPKNNTEAAGHDAWAAYGFEAEPRGTIDVFILGDSESRTSVSPMQMYHDEGITSYCCGVNSENLTEAKQMLRRILKTQSPKLVILECNVLFTKFDWKDVLLEEAGYVFPVITWHNRWKSLNAEDSTSVPDYTSREVRKGYYHSRVSQAAPIDMQERYMAPDTEEEKLDAINVHVLGEIASICRKNGIDLLLLSTPSVKNWTMAKHNTCERLAENLNEKAAGEGVRVDFVDMNLMTDVIPIDWETDTRDKGDHLNNLGVEKVCVWLAPWLKENYGLEDHREDPACRQSWTDMYDDYLEWIT